MAFRFEVRRGMNCVALAVMLLPLGGCGEKVQGRAGLVPVTGKVTIDGNPLTKGTISFISDEGKEAFTSQIDGTGNYKLGASVTDPGALPGEYKVIVIATELPKMDDPAKPQPPKSLVPEKYNKKETSGLTGSVKSGTNTINFDLKSS